jgi:hypothetical protein
VSEDQPGAAPPPRAGEGAPSEEELRAALEEQMRRLTVSDVLLQTVVTLVNLAGRKLTVEDEKDRDQAKKAIDAVRALLPLCPEEEAKAVKDALAQLQMLYVRESGQQPEEGDERAGESAERAKARSKIWTPPGT